MHGRKPDVVIAGAGPAGSTACYLLAGLGFRVLLLEKSEFSPLSNRRVADA